MEPASLVMERKMLLGIKQRAERLATEEKRKQVSEIAERTRDSPLPALGTGCWPPPSRRSRRIGVMDLAGTVGTHR